MARFAVTDRRVGAAFAAALVLAVAAATATAQLDEQLDVGETLAVDTDVTPVAKDRSVWSLVAGARYGRVDVIEGSATDFDVDLFDVSFVSNKRGFVGGAECLVEPASPEGTESCARGPVVYSYVEHKTGEKVWSRADLGAGGDEPGFVGAIAWLDNSRAVAVGGSGCYPRREEPCPDGRASGGIDPIAGAGRAWYFDGSSWRELSEESGELPAGVGGMTALDFQVGAKGAFGAAGALGQIVEWRKDRFDRVLDKDSPDSELYNHRFLRHRVREIRFSANGDAHAYAVTAGWSESDELSSPPVVVQYLGSSWSVRKFGLDATNPADPERTRGEVNSTNWLVSGKPGNEERACARVRPWMVEESFLQVEEVCQQYSCWWAPAVPTCPLPEIREQGSLEQHGVQLEEGTGDEVYDAGGRDLDERQGVPDSFYSLTRVGNCFSALMSDGGPEADGEPASMLTQRSSHRATTGAFNAFASRALSTLVDPVVLLSRPRLTTARLVAGDGDSTTAKTQPETLTTRDAAGCGGSDTGDGFPDWSVGELRSEETAGLGRRGLFMSTHLRPPLTGGSNATVNTSPPGTDELGNYEPTSDEKLVAHLESGYTRAPSYGLNAVDILDEFGGGGFAVGDHGAILSLSKEDGGGAGVEPDPPRLGSGQPQRLSDRSPYAGFAAFASEPGVVPALERQPLDEADEPRFAVTAFVGGVGTAGIRKIVMSRTGDEGWAFRPGSGTQGGALVHFDGQRWTPCDIADAEELDAACTDAPRLRSDNVLAARVPMENDDDPSNDDDFLVIALDSNSQMFYRYETGRWGREAPAASATIRGRGSDALDNPIDIAFSAPDKGLIVDRRILGAAHPQANRHRLFAFDGHEWTSCSGTCDAGGRLPRFTEQGGVSGLEAAGERIYVYGTRRVAVKAPLGYAAGVGSLPFIAFMEGGETSFAASPRAGELDPGYDPVAGTRSQPWQSGRVDGLAVVQRADGAYEGFASGVFGELVEGAATAVAPETPLLRIGSDGEWTVADAGAATDSAQGFGGSEATTDEQLAVSAVGGGGIQAFMAQRGASTSNGSRLFEFDQGRERFGVLETDLPAYAGAGGFSALDPPLHAIAADGQGGFWAAGNGFFFRYSRLARRAVFSEVPAPEREPRRRIVGLAAGGDGSLWARSNTDVVYRYERATGWERVKIPGWDRGRVVIVPSAVNAVASGPDGEGLAVGAGGRIARLSPGAVGLDRAAGRVCDLAAIVAPCGTGRDLRAVTIAPDGSALAGGDSVSLLWRPGGGEFRAIARPEVAQSVSITAIAMPEPDRAWLATDLGLVFAGEMTGDGVWDWEPENLDGEGETVSAGALHSIAVNRLGEGYALSNGGALLERDPDTGSWARIRIDPYSQRAGAGGNQPAFTAIALSDDGRNALIGGQGGLVLTRTDGRFRVARAADYPGPTVGAVRALAVSPGLSAGQAEAWAQLAGPGAGRLMHYTSDPGESLLSPLKPLEPLPDAPPERPGELRFAAFGKSDCHNSEEHRCLELSGTNDYAGVVTRRIIDALAENENEGGRPLAALFTGDAVDTAAYPGNQLVESAAGQSVANAAEPGLLGAAPGRYARGPLKLRRFAELVADKSERAGVPFLGAIGAQDLSDAQVCTSFESCTSTKEYAKAGENQAWRQAMAGRPAPWGSGGEQRDGAAVRFEPVADGRLARRHRDVEASEFGVPQEAARRRKGALGGASTHYALDVVRDGGEGAAVRLVFVDSSLGSLSSSDPLQQPLEPDGGQLGWLERVLCERPGRSATGERCTREPGQPAIVVSNTPTYSYGPGFATDTAGDGAFLEATLMRYRVSALVSGRIGWNGLYWTTAPGVHEPCPGGDYQPQPPTTARRVCGESAPAAGDAAAEPPAPAKALADGLGTAAPLPPAVRQAAGATENLTGLLPTVVASGAGGKFGGEGGAKDGFWHGYSLIRLPVDGDPRGLIVEQRPVYDWVSIEAQDHVLKAGQKMTLRGFARGPVGTTHRPDGSVSAAPVNYDRIDGPAVTHRYDLLQADPDKPWLPAEDADGEYVPLDPAVATTDSQTGLVKAGKGRQQRTYAVGLLSVGDKAASWPLVFDPAKSFKPKPALSATIRPPAIQPQPIQPPPPIQVLSQPPTQPPATPPPPAQLPTIGNLQLPTPPQLPGIGATPTTAPTPTPPPPPAPPPPPNSGAGLPLNLNAPISPISIVPTVIPPTPPPINPAPPGGSAARKEAKQRQAATAKSEEGATEGSAQELGGDLADGRDGATGAQNMTRYEFRALGQQPQASAWARGALYGGGLGLAAVVLATGWLTARPTPRRRPPYQPAPAWARRRRR